MNRDELLSKFYNTYVYDKSFEQIKKLDLFCKTNKAMLSDKIYSAFMELCEKIVELQKVGIKENISYFNIQILRTNILFHNFSAVITAYNKDYYLDPSPVQVSFDTNEYFVYLVELRQYLLKSYKQYTGKVNEDDVENAVQMQLLSYIRYINNIARIATQRLIKSELFTQMAKDGTFSISSGEYKDFSEALYFVTDKKRDIEDVRQSINGKIKGEFFYQTFADQNLSFLDLRNENFCFSNFSNSDLSQSDMRVSYYIGANFSNCKAEFVNLKYAILHDANFEGCNLFGADLNGTIGGITEPQRDRQYSPGFLGVNFRKANLREANFAEADFSGADFRDAIFQNTDFSGTNLMNSIFDHEALGALNLSEEQLSTLIIGEDI